MEPTEKSSHSKNSSNQTFNLNPLHFLIVLAAILILSDLFQQQRQVTSIPYSSFLKALDEGKILSVTLRDSSLFGSMRSSNEEKKIETFQTVVFDTKNLQESLFAKGVEFQKEIANPISVAISSWLIPLILLSVVWIYISRRLTGGMRGGIMSLSKSKAKMFMETDVKISFADVAGVDEAEEELKEVVQFLKEPKRYARLGGRSPKGVLLVGPPGTGKTMLARAVAGEACVPFFSINGSEFVELFVGLGAARVRDLFQDAKEHAPCLLFIDEIDALGKSRTLIGPGLGGNDEKEQTLNQLLAEMDGFDTRQGIIIIAATNRPEILDTALLRAGRFDRQVFVGLPDQRGRMDILKVHLKKIAADPAIEITKIAALTAGFSGADLANLVNEAALIATRKEASIVREEDFTQAVERIITGLEQKKKVISPREKQKVAYHEMGHVTASLSYCYQEKVHKVSIIPRGLGALGYTIQRPTEDRYLLDEDEMVAKIAVLLSGRAAEKKYLRKASSGAADDLAKASDIAREMVVKLGMSPRVGLISYESPKTSPLPSSRFEYSFPISPFSARLIDQEVKRLMDHAFAMASLALDKNHAFLEAGVEKLLATETLNETDITDLWRIKEGKPLGRAELQELQEQTTQDH